MKQFKLHHTIVFWRKVKYICVVLKKLIGVKRTVAQNHFFWVGLLVCSFLSDGMKRKKNIFLFNANHYNIVLHLFKFGWQTAKLSPAEHCYLNIYS